MVKKRVRREIDKAIKEIWLTEICREYGEGRLLEEADVQSSLYHHLRMRLDPLFAENSLYIYREFYAAKPGRRGWYKIDLAICEMDMSLPGYWRDCWTDAAAVIELKYGGSDEWITSDFPKLRHCMNLFGKDCQYYFGVIDTREMFCLNWLDGRSRWAKNCFTELNSGCLDGEMYFEVNSYNDMNLRFQRKRKHCDFIW